MSEVTVYEDPARTVTPQFPAGAPGGLAAINAANVNLATVSVEQERAIAEVKGKLAVARAARRSVPHAYAELMQVCANLSFAESAFYSYSRGGETVSDVTIRFAEEIARVWGNIEYGLKEMAQYDGRSEMRAFAWDLETNTLSSQDFTVAHIRDTRTGGKALTSQRDIYELTANMGGRRLRARILAIMPKWLIQEAREACEQTIARGVATNLPETRRKLIAVFAKEGVTIGQIEARVGHAIDNLTADEVVDLRKIFTSLREGHSKVGDWFGLGAGGQDTAAEIVALSAQQKAGAPAQPKVEAQPKPETKPETKPVETKISQAHEPASAPTRVREPEPAPAPRHTAEEDLF